MMKSSESCHICQLASNACCDVSLCEQCIVVHLRIGPVSLKLPPDTFQYVCEAVMEAAGRIRDYVPASCQPKVAAIEHESTKH